MPGSHRKHTPITSKAQQGMFGAELARRRAGKEPQMSGITTKELRSHLQESAGKDLPEYVSRCSGGPVTPRKSKSGSPPMTDAEMAQGYRSLGSGLKK